MSISRRRPFTIGIFPPINIQVRRPGRSGEREPPARRNRSCSCSTAWMKAGSNRRSGPSRQDHRQRIKPLPGRRLVWLRQKLHAQWLSTACSTQTLFQYNPKAYRSFLIAAHPQKSSFSARSPKRPPARANFGATVALKSMTGKKPQNHLR